MGSWKLKSGVNKGDVREKKKGDLKNKEKKIKIIVKHERGIVIILTFEFEHITPLTFIFYFKSKSIDFKYRVF